MTRRTGMETPPAQAETDAPGAGGERSLRETAEDLLSVADSVAQEGWGDTVAAHLRQAAHDLLRLARPEDLAGRAAGVSTCIQ